jgi:predicted nuclease of predicted toxin-antitoxin system
VNLLANEGVDQQVVARLRDEGHTVLYVAEMQSGISDEAVLNLANREDRALLTTDKDFGELVFRQGLLTRSGVVLIRLTGLRPEDKARIVASTIEEHTAELVPGTFTVITPGAVRIRRTNP